jgi:hypothetical protein
MSDEKFCEMIKHDFVMLNPLADTPATRGAIEQASQMLNRILWE